MDYNENEIPDDFPNEFGENSEEAEKEFEPLEEMDVLDKDFNSFNPNNEPINNIKNFCEKVVPMDNKNNIKIS